MPGSRRNKLVIDHNDRVYCFWFREDNNGSAFYRYLENEEWSDIIIPYDNNELNGLENCVVDSENNLHCIGPHWFSGQGNTDSKPTYFSYNYNNNEWSTFEQFGETFSWYGMDIDMDENEKPHLVWQEYVYQSNGSLLSGTFYNFQDENDLWTLSIYLGEGYSNQRILIDNHNQTNIFHLESIEEVSLLIHYYKYNTIWISYILPIENVGDFEVEKYDNQICIVLEDWDIGTTNTCEVKFTKTDLIDYTKTEEQNNDFYISPNPSKQNLNINFHLENMERVTIHIYNLQGELIRALYDGKMESGNHQLEWNPKDEGRQLNSGLYFIRLQTKHTISTQKLEFIR